MKAFLIFLLAIFYIILVIIGDKDITTYQMLVLYGVAHIVSKK